MKESTRAEQLGLLLLCFLILIYMTKTYRSNPSILNELRDYIDGLMLSDGSIGERSNTGWYIQGCKYKDWLDVIGSNFYEYNIECSISDGKVYFGECL